MVWRRHFRDPWEEMRRMEEWMDRMFRETWPYYAERRALPGAAGGELAEIATPSVDVKDEEGKIIVAADIPGVEKGDISISVKGDMLEITAEKKEEKEEKEEGYLRRERSYRKFYRSIPLPTEVDKDKAEASLKDGVLKISMPKLKEAEEVKKIELK
jgi:HSP20 family protein